MSTATEALQSDDSRDGGLGRIFPRQIDNKFHGAALALWLLGFYSLIRLIQGGMSAFNTFAIATGPDGIPVDSYSPAAAQTVLAIFALLGLNVMVLPALGLLALIRYRAMIPLVYLMMLILNLSGRAVQLLQPIIRAGGTQPVGFYMNLGLLAVLLLGFCLSLLNRSKAAGREA